VTSVVLVRHGQASWDAEDYDRLTALGADQSATLGRAMVGLAAPDLVMSGAHLRHRDTAGLAMEAAGWQLPVQVDTGWNEFDHRLVLAAYGTAPPEEGTAAFGRWFHEALARWTEGGSDADYDEPFASFTSRVDVALRHLRGELGPSDTAVVFTSAGPICWTVAALLGGQTQVWLHLLPSLVNASITRIRLDARGMHLTTFNEHSHLGPESVTFW
jgi:broad specificity phosphatase PhoE